jgi:hypothetical protein
MSGWGRAAPCSTAGCRTSGGYPGRCRRLAVRVRRAVVGVDAARRVGVPPRSGLGVRQAGVGPWPRHPAPAVVGHHGLGGDAAGCSSGSCWCRSWRWRGLRSWLAGVAGLRRVCGVDLLDPPGSLLLQAGHELPPALAADGAVQPGLGSDVPTGRGSGAACRAGHAGDLEVFDADQVEAASQVGTGFLDPVLAPVGLSHSEASGLRLDLGASARPSSSTSEASLQPEQSLGFLHPEADRAGHGAVRHRYCHRHASVHTDDLACAGRGDRLGDDRERDVPAASPIPRHPIGLPVGQCAGPTEAHPSHLRDQDRGPAVAVLADTQRMSTNHAEPLAATFLPPCWATVGSREEVAPRLIQVAQRLVLDRRYPLSQPGGRIPRLGELSTLLVVIGSGALPAAPHEPLLKAQIPHVPGLPALLNEQFLLMGRGVHPVAGHDPRDEPVVTQPTTRRSDGIMRGDGA